MDLLTDLFLNWGGALREMDFKTSETARVGNKKILAEGRLEYLRSSTSTA